MNKTQKITQSTARQWFTSSLIIGIAIVLLLTACDANASASTKQSNTPTPVQTPTISATTVQQGEMQLDTFQQWITLMKQYNGDVTNYQSQYSADQQALHNAHTDDTYNAALATLSNQINEIKLPALKAEAVALHQTLEDNVAAWGAKHTYHDDYDGITYKYGYEYTDSGIVGDDVAAIDTAETPKDLQQIIEDLNAYQTNFQAMTEDANDKTPYGQSHKTDTDLMKKYGDMQGKVVVVSLYEQALRTYNNGQLVKAMQVTTGELKHPSLPGAWTVEQKESPTVFKSVVPKGDPDYYPDTPINYAMLYHSGGYNLHDAWWRNDYGQGTQFPHSDSSGNSSSAHGSHGCVNMQEDNAAWLYSYVSIGTSVIIY